MLEPIEIPQTIHYQGALPATTKTRVILKISGTQDLTFPGQYYITDLRVMESSVLSLRSLDLSGLLELRTLRLATPLLSTINYPPGLTCLKAWESGISSIPHHVLQGLTELWMGEQQMPILLKSTEKLANLRRLFVVCEHEDEEELAASSSIKRIYSRCPNVVICYEQHDQV